MSWEGTTSSAALSCRGPTAVEVILELCEMGSRSQKPSNSFGPRRRSYPCLFRRFWFRFHRPARRQSGVLDLIKERTIADLEYLGGAPAVPVVGLQHLEDDVTLQAVDCLAGHLFERYWSIFRNVDFKGAGYRFAKIA